VDFYDFGLDKTYTIMSDLKTKAIALGLCADFQKTWSEDLVGMYKQGITWCAKHQYPSLEDMQPYKEMLEENDIFCSRSVDLLMTDDTYILNNCTGKAEINDYNVSGLYVALDSVLELTVGDNSILVVETYDNTILRVTVAENAKCTVWQYGNSVIQVISGNVKIFKK